MNKRYLRNKQNNPLQINLNSKQVGKRYLKKRLRTIVSNAELSDAQRVLIDLITRLDGSDPFLRHIIGEVFLHLVEPIRAFVNQYLAAPQNPQSSLGKPESPEDCRNQN